MKTENWKCCVRYSIDSVPVSPFRAISIGLQLYLLRGRIIRMKTHRRIDPGLQAKGEEKLRTYLKLIQIYQDMYY